MLNIWTKPSNYSIGAFEENSSIMELLPVSIDGANFSLISGKLPAGLSIDSGYIVGVLAEVPRETTFKFCIRATLESQISDRTFTMTVIGSDPTEILTPADILAIGPYQQLYAMEETYINFQIQAIDNDTAAGQKLNYFIASDNGILPPGLTLSSDGLISGFVEPILSLSPTGISPDGYDSYDYDSIFYDMSFFELILNELNKTYSFIITITDGDSIATQEFAIFVIGNKYLRVDNDVTTVDSDLITSDSSSVLAPIWITPANLGVYRANNYVTIPIATYATLSVRYEIDDATYLPPGLFFDTVTGGVYGIIPFQSSAIKTYSFTITAIVIDGTMETASTSRTFTVDIIGELASTITWQTLPNLGTIYANTISDIAIVAKSSLITTTIRYEIVEKIDEGLPNGLQLELDGSISGKATLDNITNNKFTIRATDSFGLAYRTFALQINMDDQQLYSNISVKPMMSLEHREIWNNFINDSSIFTASSLYRMTDKNYGLQTELTMLIYAGIQQANASVYVTAMNQNHKRKRFQFGDVVIETATNLNTNEPIYEVICISMFDSLEPAGKRLPLAVTPSELSNPTSITYYPNSISNWCERIKKATDDQSVQMKTNHLYLPLWMQSAQTNQLYELGFVLMIPICFCKLGTAADILLNIKHSKFDFKLLDYSVDRYIIDAVSGYEYDKYLEFKNEKNTIGQ